MNKLKVITEINKPIDEVWDAFNNPEHIVKWNFAHESWECPYAKNDLKVGGKLESRMQAKDGSFGFDFIGTYNEVKENELIKYHMEDGREVEVIFERLSDDKTKVTENFEPENQNPLEFQKDGWQAILDNFKNYSESKSN
ncbi:SRPBCC family protein [Epilithonimonas pallida]|jgi:uncharacterized protein YndB with AHSA1/START domain|uniref:Uncharacterized conserved protein YndB, AHSA1/START domain n=1 Tax=Epilithonimonas pallida TaxID=373671 RepID=A0ABY1R603_9FLAO|nr:SRPBCC family protein [Epilithonimonas pallida]SMP96756.1 Uncharacterized conserved protein YndB, AHSA1/START domain [Epilithonimonas pallida]